MKLHYYTQKDVDYILQQRKEGVSIPQIAKKMGRTSGSVAAKIKKLRNSGIVVPTTRDTHPKDKKSYVRPKKNEDGTLIIAENSRPQKVRVQVDRRTSYMIAPERVAKFKKERGLI